MKKKEVLFCMILYLVSSEISNVSTLDGDLSAYTVKPPEEDERWSWGFVDKTVRPPITTTPSVNERNVPPDCNGTVEPDYDERIRISKKKCHEYKWYNKDPRCEPYDLLIPVSITGGINAAPAEFPHMCALGWKAVTGTWIFKCGGSLISPNFVLTAAHCTKASSLDTSIKDVEPKIIRFGDKNIIDATPGTSFQPRDANIKRIIVHPQYKSPKKYNDIALIEMDKEFTFEKNLRPACLWSEFDTSFLGPEAYITGWGVIESGTRKTRPVLQKAKIDLITSETCDQLLRGKCNRHWCGLNETQICAGVLSGGIDSCQGDSGGPLAVPFLSPDDSEETTHYLIGVISFGFECSHKDTPGIYTRVSAFIDWIESIVWKYKYT